MRTATIVIKDEVNIKIEGLDLDTRKALVNAFKYENPAARYMPAVRLGRWDGKASYFQLGGSTYTNLLPEIIPILEQYNWDVELDDQRDYSVSFDFMPVEETTFAHKVWPKGHPAVGQPIVLRDYQQDIINNFLENPQCIQEVATGAGKTVMTAALSNAVTPFGRSIVIVPNKSLVTQTEKDYINMEQDVGVYFGDRKEWGRQHTICTWQSLNVLDKKSKNWDIEEALSLAEFLHGVQTIIVDEVHMAKAEVLKKLLTINFAHTPIRWGLTGTVPKDDLSFESIRCALGDVVHRVSAHDLQQKGILSECHVNIVQLQDSVEYKDYQSELKYLVTSTERLSYLARMIESIKESGNTLILVDRIETGKILQTELSTLFSLLKDKPEVAFVSGATKATDRKDEYDEIATSTNKIIIATYGVAAVGINIPRIFNLVLIEPGKSFVRVIQSIGRGIRKAEDKDFVQIWDITSTCKFAKRHLTKRKQFYKEANYPFTQEKLEWMKIK